MKWRPLSAFLISIACTGQGIAQSPNPRSTSLDTTAVHLLLRQSRASQWIDPSLSLSYADSALVLSQRLGYSAGSAMAKNLKGFAFWTFGDNDLAFASAIEALQLTGSQLPAVKAESYYIAARAYLDIAQQAKALEAIHQAEQLAIQSNDWELICSIYNLRGVIQFVGDRKDSALYFYNRAFELGKAHAIHPINFPRMVSNIGECYADENPKLAFTYFLQAMELAKGTGNQIAKASIGAIIGHAYLRASDLKNAETNLTDALNLARSLGLRRVVRHAYAGLVDIRIQQGKVEEAMVFQRRFFEVRDSLLNTSKMRQIVELEGKHALELKEQNIRLLENEKKIQSMWNNLLVGAVILLALLSVGVYQWQQYRYRKNREVLDLEIDYLTQRQQENQMVQATAPSAETIESMDQKLLRTAIATVEKHLGDPGFSVESMAADMSMSRTSLHRKIKSVTGFAPSELIRTIRLRKAAKLILSRADTVTQIAIQVGFDDYSHFSKSFKKHFGVSPTQYEEQARS